MFKGIEACGEEIVENLEFVKFLAFKLSFFHKRFVKENLLFRQLNLVCYSILESMNSSTLWPIFHKLTLL